MGILVDVILVGSWLNHSTHLTTVDLIAQGVLNILLFSAGFAAFARFRLTPGYSAFLGLRNVIMIGALAMILFVGLMMLLGRRPG